MKDIQDCIADAGRRRGWAVVALLFAFMLINWADKAVIGLSAVPIIRELHLTHTQFGLVGSAFFLLFPISGVIGGFLVNRMRSKPVLAAMAVLWALAQLPMAGMVGLQTLLASRIVLGLGEGPALPIALHAVYKWFDDKRRAWPTSIVITGAPFGAGVIAPLIVLIIVHYTWHTAFAVLGVASLAWTVAWLAIGREGAAGQASAAVAAQPARAAAASIAYRRLIFSRTALGVFLAGFAAYWVLTLNVIWLAGYLIQAAGFKQAQVGWIVALPALAQILLGPAISLASQKLTLLGVPNRLARGGLGGLCVVISGVALVLMPMLSSAAAEIAMVTLAFSICGIIFPLGATLIGEITPMPQRGAMLGIMNSVQTVAGLLAPIIMGRLVDLGANPAAGFRSGFVMAGVFVLVCGLLGAWLMHPESDRRRLGLAEAAQPA